MNNHHHVSNLHRYSKPSRWRQPLRVTRTPQLQRSPSATRCNHSSKYTWNHSRSHYDDESRMEMSGRCLRLMRMSSMSKCHENKPQASQTLYIDTPNEIERLCSKGWLCEATRRTDRYDRTQHPQRPIARSPPHVLVIQPRSLDLNGQVPEPTLLSDDRTHCSNELTPREAESDRFQRRFSV
jgi:hypothetical protein